MKIIHNIKRTECTLSGQILETIFEEGEKSGDGVLHYSKDGNYYICSMFYPEIFSHRLCVWGLQKYRDNEFISNTFSSEEEAQKILDYINEFTVNEPVEVQKKSHTYTTQYLRDDGVLFTEKEIDGKPIEELEKEEKKHIEEARRIRGLLNAHRNKFTK